jgi:hypothetical protein
MLNKYAETTQYKTISATKRVRSRALHRKTGQEVVCDAELNSIQLKGELRGP